MELNVFLEKTRKEVDAELESFFPKKASVQWASKTLGKSDYGFDELAVQNAVFNPVWDFLERGGKRWRPALMLLACESVGGKKADALKFSIIPELLHNGTIMVDDVEDNSLLRRGKKATHLIYGVDVAVNAGNLMYYLPMALVYNSGLAAEKKAGIYDSYSREMLRLSFGQAMDIQWHHGCDDVSENQYLEMCSYKTGSLARFSVVLGGILGGASENQLAALSKFATSIGIAFQIQDDILNIKPPEGWGKEVGDDIKEGKRTLIVIHAFSVLSAEKKVRLIEILNSENASDADVAEAICVLSESGSIDYASRFAKKIVLESWKRLEELINDSDAKNMLRAFADYVVQRKI
jgi:geranylgeranyl diphosphate synthase, type I